MRIQNKDPIFGPMHVVGLVGACAASIAIFLAWIPTSLGGPGANVAPAQLLSAAEPHGGPGEGLRDSRPDSEKCSDGSNLDSEAVELALFLDWHMNAGGGYRTALDGLSCTTHAPEAAPAPTRKAKKL